MRNLSLGPALSYAEAVQAFLTRVWALVAAAIVKLQVPDAGRQATALRDLYGRSEAARTGKRGLSRSVRSALKAAEVQASLVLAEVKSYLLDQGKVDEARALPKKEGSGLGRRKARLQRILAVVEGLPQGVLAGSAKELASRIAAVHASEDAVPFQGKDARPMTKELHAQLTDLVERCAAFVEVCRGVARLVDNPALAEGAPIQPGPSSHRRKKADKAADATEAKAADAKADANAKK